MRRAFLQKTILQWQILAAMFLVLGGVQAAHSQEILLDQGFKAGELMVFPVYGDAKKFYYVPDKAHLAVDENDQPQFSFLKYVSNVKSEAGEKDNNEGEGGGIVHCLVQLGATPDQVKEAEAQVRRKAPGATLAGPVIFKSGKFGIVSSFKQDDGDLTTKVLGIGNAPILDGEKAAVSIRLTKLGAKILWDSFKTTTPDISFTFEMEMSGYRNPYEARLEANFDQVYKHRAFNAGIAANLGKVFVGAQIRDVLDDLKSSGAIKLVTKGGDDKLDGLIATAYGKICELMFDKMEAGSAEGGQNQELLNRATDTVLNGRSARLPEQSGGRLASHLVNFDADFGGDFALSPFRSRQYSDFAPSHFVSSGFAAQQRARVFLMAGEDKEKDKTGKAPAGNATTIPDASADTNRKPATDLETKKPPVAADNGNAGNNPKEKTQPSFSLMASYEMKTVHRSGVFKLEFNKFTQDTLQLRFDENIGNLSKLMKDPNHFYEVNLEQAIFKQREISVFLDGQNAADFDKYVNYVTVRMRKKHQGGDETDDEVRIDRSNFNKNGNFFKLLYGWKDDKSRDKWFDYEYNEVWSFQGGTQVDMGWKPSRNFSLTVTPPFEKRTLHLEADPDTVKAAGIRLISVTVHYDLGGKDQTKQATLNPTGGQLSQTLEYIRPASKNDYSYEISWRMKDGRTVTSGKKTATDEFIFCDDVPGAPAGGGQ